MIYGRIITMASAAVIAVAATSGAFAKGPKAAQGTKAKAAAAFGFANPGQKSGWSGINPPGWSQGKKKGWDCVVGAPNCKPPGLQHKLDD